MYDVDVEVAKRDVAVVEVVAVGVADRAEGAKKNCAILCRRVLDFVRRRQVFVSSCGGGRVLTTRARRLYYRPSRAAAGF